MSYYTYKDCKLYYETKGQGIPLEACSPWDLQNNGERWSVG